MALTDQQIRDAGILYLAPQQYLKNPFLLPKDEENVEESGGITLTNVGQTGGGGGASPFNLTPTFLSEPTSTPAISDISSQNLSTYLSNPALQNTYGNFAEYDEFMQSQLPPPSLIDKGVGAFKNLFKPRRIRGELGNRLLNQYNLSSKLPSYVSALASLRSPFNPESPTFNPDLVGQLNFLEAQDGLIGRDQGSGILKYGPESVLFGKNVISGFGTNDYEEALNKYIESAKLKLRRTTNDETRKKIQKRIDKGELELTTYLDKSGVQKDRDDRRQDIITKETKRREDKGDTTRAGSEDTATGGFGGGKDLAFKKGGLAKILGY